MSFPQSQLTRAQLLLQRYESDILDDSDAKKVLATDMHLDPTDAALLLHEVRKLGAPPKPAKYSALPVNEVARVFMSSRGGNTFERISPYTLSDAQEDAIKFLRQPEVSRALMKEAPGIVSGTRVDGAFGAQLVRHRAMYTAVKLELTAYLLGRRGNGGPPINMLQNNNTLASLTAMVGGFGLSHERSVEIAKTILPHVGSYAGYTAAVLGAEKILREILAEAGEPRLDQSLAEQLVPTWGTVGPQRSEEGMTRRVPMSFNGQIKKMMSDKGMSWEQAAHAVAENQEAGGEQPTVEVTIAASEKERTVRGPLVPLPHAARIPRVPGVVNMSRKAGR